VAGLLVPLWTYIVKYWLPPKLPFPVSDPPSHFQGLDLGPK
jgi:hypothetical protein